jgi:ABC-2 type transport system ATP-binding protein
LTERATPAIRVQGLVKRYSGRAVVDGISFEVANGEIFALLGPNGAGKTTTLEIIEGYRRADDGTVAVLGVDPARGGSALHARVGLMLQGGGIDPRARPAEVLRLYAAFHASPRDPRELLRIVGLTAVASTPYRQLSGGERQRLGFALALIGKPELLVLDEPTAGMDPAARSATRELVRSMRDDGVATLLTTHDLGDVERVADRVAIIDHGRIVAAGTPAELVAGTSPRLTVWFAQPVSSDDVTALVANLPPGVNVTRSRFDPRQLAINGPPPDPLLVSIVAAWAAGRALLISGLRTAGGTLEDRYLELTGDAAAIDNGGGADGEGTIEDVA